MSDVEASVVHEPARLVAGVNGAMKSSDVFS